MVSGPRGVFAGALTTTEIVQVPGAVGVPGGIVPPVKFKVVGVPAGVKPIFPPQLLLAMLSIVRGAGIVSANAAPVYGVLFGFCSVMFSVVVPPCDILGGENAFVRPISRTFNRAVAGVLFVRFWLFPSELAGIVLV